MIEMIGTALIVAATFAVVLSILVWATRGTEG